MTGQQLYKYSLDLLCIVNRDGTEPGDADDLGARALSLINILLAENAELDCRIQRKEHAVTEIASLEETLDVSDITAYSVLPYGLASLLIIGEDDPLAADMNRLYLEGRKKALSFGKAKAVPITEVYQ